MTNMNKKILKSLMYVSYIQKGNKPRHSTEALKHFVEFLSVIEKCSINKEKHPIKIGITTPEGNVDLDLLEDCGYVLHHLFSMIITSPDEKKFEKYFKASTSFLESKDVSILSKICIIDMENQSFKDGLERAFSTVTIGLSALEARMKLCGLALSNPDDECFGNEQSIRNIYEKYASKSIEYHVNKGQLLQAEDFLKSRLLLAKSSNEKAILVNSIVSHSSSFNLSSKSELNCLLEEHEESLEPQDLEFLSSTINTEPGGLVVQSFSFGNGTLSINSTEDKEIVTIIRFSIPNTCNENKPQEIQIDENVTMLLSPVSVFWADPMFKIMSGWKIANMGWSHFCDVEPQEGNSYTHVQLILQGLYIPDVVLKDDSYDPIDFSEKEALMGRTYYPHKEFVIKTFLENIPLLKQHLDIETEDISINLFSNYFVQHVDSVTGGNIHHKLYAMTNPNSYSKTLTRFVERLNSVNLSDALVDVRELLTSTKIETEKTLKEFVFRCVDICVKHNIENHGGYRYLWKNDQNGIQIPCREPESQPYIYSHLKVVFDFMGIQLSREVESSNGEVDFLISYTNNHNKLLKLCVELKLAHSTGVEKGLTKQLPAYLKGERCKYGIYLVLWYKCNLFDKPTKYTTLSELETRLNTINTCNTISNIVIDCTKPTSPSMLK
ncbi:MAG: hypothetical protein HRU24_07685 [Gammaproteobacteria bacterium]|nr:hypothetical protein [Gammaproteobacteria bacterium]